MNKALKILFFFLILLIGFSSTNAQFGYKESNLEIVKIRVDSLSKRSSELNDKLIKSRHNPVQVARLKDELEMTTFKLDYEKHFLDETLDAAKILVEKKLAEAERNYRDDLHEVYLEYKKDNLHKIKMQKLKYQEMFEKEKKFKKYIEPYIIEDSKKDLEQAAFITDLAMKYAEEQNFVTAQEFIRRYRGYIDCYLLDLESDLDLKKLTSNKGYFSKNFEPLIKTDDLGKFEKAKKMVDECLFYSSRKETKLGIDYFLLQQKIIQSRLIDKEQELALAGFLDKGELTSKKEQPMDDLNDFGVFRYYDKIIVIGKFNPAGEGLGRISATDPKIMKGMAIISADRALLTYVKRKMGIEKKNLKVVHAFLIPYTINGAYEWFFPVGNTGDRQYRVAYTLVGNDKITQTLLREHLKPITFTGGEIE